MRWPICCEASGVRQVFEWESRDGCALSLEHDVESALEEDCFAGTDTDSSLVVPAIARILDIEEAIGRPPTRRRRRIYLALT